MRSANDPGGGGLDETAGAAAEAGFWAVDALSFEADFDAPGAGFGRDFDVVVGVGFADAAFLGTGLLGFDGRRNCSSALRFVPAAGLFEAESRDSVLGLRTSDFAVDEDTGGSG